MLQLDFFKTVEECEVDDLRKQLDETHRSLTAVRRGTYARLNEISKENVELKARLVILERHICTGEK